MKLSFGFDCRRNGQSYWFDWGKVRGFQFGDPPSSGPSLCAYSATATGSTASSYVAAGTSGRKIAQDDIDTIVQTVQPVPIAERP